MVKPIAAAHTWLPHGCLQQLHARAVSDREGCVDVFPLPCSADELRQAAAVLEEEGDHGIRAMRFGVLHEPVFCMHAAPLDADPRCDDDWPDVDLPDAGHWLAARGCCVLEKQPPGAQRLGGGRLVHTVIERGVCPRRSPCPWGWVQSPRQLPRRRDTAIPHRGPIAIVSTRPVRRDAMVP